MPFLKPIKKVLRSREIENTTLKNGWHSKIYASDGSAYTGDWKDNMKHGKGKETMKSHILYEGDFRNNYACGHGVYASATSQHPEIFNLLYRGTTNHGVKSNMGSYHENNTYYIGDWKRGKQEGYGLCWYPDGSFYSGEFSKGVRHGSGMFVRTDGNRYEGEWKDGAKHGNGRFFHLDKGQMQEGVWVKDICVFSTIQIIPFRQRSLFPTSIPIPETYVAKYMFKEREAEALEGKSVSCLSFSNAVSAVTLRTTRTVNDEAKIDEIV